MASFVSNVATVLFLAALISQQAHARDAKKDAGCKLSDIKVTHEKTGKVVQGYPEYRVTIENRCSCPMFDIKVHCNNMPAVEPVDSTQIKGAGVLCKVAPTALSKGESVSFTYAWKTTQDFTVVSATPDCDEERIEV